MDYDGESLQYHVSFVGKKDEESCGPSTSYKGLSGPSGPRQKMVQIRKFTPNIRYCWTVFPHYRPWAISPFSAFGLPISILYQAA